MSRGLRLLTESDAPAVMAVMEQPHVRRALLLDDLDLTWARVGQVLTRAEPGTLTEALGMFGEDGALIGVISLAHQHPVHRSATITNLAAPRRAGAALGLEVIRRTLAYAFGPRNLRRVECRVLSDNRVTPRLLRHLRGVRLEGVARQAVHRDGHYLDMAQYAVLKEEWHGDSGSPG